MAAKVPAVSSSATVGLCASEQWIRERLNLHQDSLGKFHYISKLQAISSFLFGVMIILDDVRSLSLPGSYSEKITHFGRSLLNFTRLKHLDISRNAIESLEVGPYVILSLYGLSSSLQFIQGLEHLKFLETLNLYPFYTPPTP